MKKALLLLGTIILFILNGCINSNNNRFPFPPQEPGNPSNTEQDNHLIKKNDIRIYNVFTAGEWDVNSYRIPTLVSTKAGSLLLFCEARKLSWRDHTNAAVVMKRSTDGGKTWSDIIEIANDNFKGAYCDQCPVVDMETGEIFVLMQYWPVEGKKDAKQNTAWLTSSKDDGLTWSPLEDVSETMVAPGHALQGVGVGSGIQMQGKKYKGRLIIPTRQIDKKSGLSRARTVYSDDHGKTWHVGQPLDRLGEHEIAETPVNKLLLSIRGGDGKYQSRSHDGGETWTASELKNELPKPVRGCQASLLSKGNVVLFTSPRGGSYSDTIDDRCNLTLYRSKDCGETWTDQCLLYQNAAGYSSLAMLPDGRICVAYEAGDTYGFIRTHAPRSAGWMRLDVIVVPAEVTDPNCWFN